VALTTGNNYFFLTYDISSGPANAGHSLASTLTGVGLVSGTAPAPTLSGPTQALTILGPMSGTYLVGQGNTFPNFTSISAALTDLRGRGVSGPVIFSLTNDTVVPYNAANGETFPLSISVPHGSSATNTVTVKPAAGKQPLVVNALAEALFKLSDASNIILDGSNTGGGSTRDLTLTNTHANSTALVWISSSATGTGTGPNNNKVLNLNLNGGSNAVGFNSSGVNVSSDTYNVQGNDNDNVTVSNNSIQRTYYGIVFGAPVLASNGGLDGVVITNNLIGPAVASSSDNIGLTAIYLANAIAPVVTGNTIRNVGNTGNARGLHFQHGATTPTISNNSITNVSTTGTAYGMYFESGITGATVTSNTISSVASTSAGDATGLLLGPGFTNAVVDGNKVLTVSATGSTWGGHGIDINTGSASSNLRVSNNFVAGVAGAGTTDLSGLGGITGIRLRGTTPGGISLYHNTVSMSGTAGTTNRISAALYVGAGATGLVLRNNILVNTQTSANATNSYAFYSSSAKTAYTTINHNAYYTTAAAKFILGNIGGDGTSTSAVGLNLATLAAFQAASGTGQDASSISLDPQFTSTTDLHINTRAVAVGTPIAGITADIDGETRNATTPYLGADEASPVDVKPTALVAPAASGCFGSTEAVTVTVQNTGTLPLDLTTNPITVTVNVTTPGGPLVLTGTANTNPGGLPLALDATINVSTSATLNMTAAGTYTFAVTATAVGDGLATNNTLSPAPANRVVAALAVGTASASPVMICGASGAPTLTVSSFAGGSLQWQSSPSGNPGTFTDLPAGTTTPFTAPAISAPTYYQAVVTCNTSLTSNVVTVTYGNPTVSGSNTPVTRCGPGAVTLTATASAGATINWFDSNTSNVVLATGGSYSPTVTTTRQFFASAKTNQTEALGRTAPVGTGSTSTASGLVFSTTAAFTLTSVVVYPTGSSAPLTVQVQDNTGTLIPGLTATITTPTGTGTTPFTVPLNFVVPIGTNMRLTATATSGLVRENSIFPLTYTSANGTVSITSGNNTGSPISNSYYYFYNWQINTACTSARTAVDVNVTTPPTLSPAATTQDLCQGSSTSITYSGYANLSVSPSTGTSVVGNTVTFTPTALGLNSYTVTGNDGTGPSGCTNTATVALTLKPTPNAPGLTSPTTYCAGGSTTITASANTLSASGTPLDENFNGATNSFTVTSSGFPAADWLVRTPPFSYNTSLTSWNGADGTKFMLSISDGTTSSTAIMTSPVFSTLNYTAAALTFDQMHRYLSGGTVAVEGSVNGAAFATLATYTSDQATGSATGTAPTFLPTSIPLTAGYLNQANVRIRFRYVGTNDWYWAVDNVKVSGTYTDQATFAVSPATNATVVGSQITFSPGTTTAYTVTASYPSSGCPSVGTPVTINVNPLPTASLSNSGPVCNGSNGTATLTLGGSAGPWNLSYTVNSGPAVSLTNQTSPLVINLPAPLAANQTIQLTALADAGTTCVAAAATLSAASTTVVVDPLPTATLSNSGPVCEGNPATVTVSLNGVGPFDFTYTVNGANPVSVTAVAGPTYTITNPSLLADETYALTALTTAHGCSVASLSSATTTVYVGSTWTGGAGSSDWYDVNNWSGGCLPSATRSAFIPNGVTMLPAIAALGAVVKNLTILGTSTLAMIGTCDLHIKGSCTMTATMLQATGGTVTFSGVGAQSIPAASFYNLVVDGPVAKVLSGPVSVAHDLDLSAGQIALGNADLRLLDGAGTILGADATHFLITNGSGRLAVEGMGSSRGTVTFPIGSSASSYTPATLANAGTSDVLFARVADGISRQGNAVTTHVVNKTWDLSEGTPGGSATAVTLQWNTADEIGGFQRGASDMAHYQNGEWNRLSIYSRGPATTVSAGVYSLTRGPYTSFSPFGIADAANPLPVELTGFEARRQNQEAELSWTTASEKDNRGFEVQLSTDGREFRPLHFIIPASPNSSSPRSYGYTDREAGKQGLRYYRLRQIDLNGQEAFSPVRSLRFEEKAPASLSASPNPFRQQLALRLYSPLANPAVVLTLTDASGRSVHKQPLNLPAGSSQLELRELAGLPAGVYLLHLTLDGKPLHLKVVKE
jgi:hypothetical protein